MCIMPTVRCLKVCNQLLLPLLGIVVLGALLSCNAVPSPRASPLATPFSDLSEHEATVQAQIHNFESRWHSLDAHLNPQVQSEVALGRYLDYFGYARMNLSAEPFWIVNTSTVVTKVKVLEFSATHFKATACIKTTDDEITPQGVFIQSLNPLEMCGIYVFEREENTWKLAGYFNTADPRDWDYAPQWLKAIIGELPAN